MFATLEFEFRPGGQWAAAQKQTGAFRELKGTVESFAWVCTERHAETVFGGGG
jgi:hypothetical protein